MRQLERETTHFTPINEELNPESLPDRYPAEISETEFVKSIDDTRPLTDYATVSDIADFLKKRRKVHNINPETLSKNGLVIQDDMEVYLQDPSYNSSTLKEALKSPLHLYYERVGGLKKKLKKLEQEEEFSRMGTFLHSCILEPDKFNKIIVEPKAKRTELSGCDTLISFLERKVTTMEDGLLLIKKAKAFLKRKRISIDKLDGKKTYYEKLKQISGFKTVSAQQKIIIDAVYSNYRKYGGGILPSLMKGALKEVSMYYTEPVTGLAARIRPDALQFAENIGHNAIISIKTTSCESLGHFYYQSAKLLYELSEGMYLDAAEYVTTRPFTCTIMIMLQTVPPFGVAALVWNGEDLEIGKYKYRQALQTVADCEAAGKYPGYDAYAEADNLGLIDMKQPSWNAKELFPTDIED